MRPIEIPIFILRERLVITAMRGQAILTQQDMPALMAAYAELIG